MLNGKWNRQKAKDELNFVLDESWWKLEGAIYENSLILPDHIVEHLYQYIDLFDTGDFLEEVNATEKQRQFEEQVNNLFDTVINAMLAILHLKNLIKG